MKHYALKETIISTLLLITQPFCLFSEINNTSLPESFKISGKIFDASSKEEIPFASIHLPERNIATISDGNGSFQLNANKNEKIHLIVSYLGYQPIDTSFIVSKNENLSFILQPQNYALSEIVVSSKESSRSNSTSIIEKTALEYIQPSSFADVLQLLPGHSTEKIDLSKSNFITMRQAGYDINTSLGTAFIINGATLSNEANLQNAKGLSGDGLHSAGAKEDFYNSGNGNIVSKGIDMRTISTDRIEKIEIVRGIPSVQYGDLTAGLVKVELKGGLTPWEGRLKVDLYNKLFSLGKGLVLPEKRGLLNFDFDYEDYNPEPRTELTSYKRATFSGRYQNKFRLSDKTDFVFKLNLNYTGSFDNKKTDRDTYNMEGDYFKQNYNNASANSNGSFQFKKSFIDELNYNISFSYTKDKLDRALWVTPTLASPISTALEEGEYDTRYLPTEYHSQLTIDGQPINLNTSLNAKSEVKTGNITQNFIAGTEFRYDKNMGKGEIYDLNAPPYPDQISTRPRPFNDVPALQKLSFFFEDNINYSVNKWKIFLQAGVRSTSMLGLSDKYEIKDKLFWEPRLNTKITLPAFFDNKMLFSITGGIGQFYKFPTQSQLFPSLQYFDLKQLDYYSQKEELRALNIKTYIKDPTNYQIQPAKNTKYEIGFILSMGNFKLDVTYFDEQMKNGFSSGTSLTALAYKNYDINSVPPESITEKPSVNDFTYTNDTVSRLYGTVGNNYKVHKRGVEYQLNLGEIPVISTKIWINGAWYLTHYKSQTSTYKPKESIGSKEYPYVGIYNYTKGQPNNRSQFNTNINFDTHIPKLRMIFTTSIQTMWYEKYSIDWNNGMPVAYFDNTGQIHHFDPETYANNPNLKLLVYGYSDRYFNTEKEAMKTFVNLKLTKEIGKNLRIAFYVNKLLDYQPDYTMGRTGTTAVRTSEPYFGAELNIKL